MNLITLKKEMGDSYSRHILHYFTCVLQINILKLILEYRLVITVKRMALYESQSLTDR